LSKLHYLKIHEILNRLPSQRIEPQIKVPHIGRRPQSKANGIYFMFEEGEIITYEHNRFDRIVYVGINEKEGNFQKRLDGYTKIDWFPPLKVKVQLALSNLRGVSLDAITPFEVFTHVNNNFKRRILPLSSANEAIQWEDKIVPIIARYSSEFASRNWLGKMAQLPYNIWNTKKTSWPLVLKDQDLLELSKIVDTFLQESELD
jgi:hypothetical protein